MAATIYKYTSNDTSGTIDDTLWYASYDWSSPMTMKTVKSRNNLVDVRLFSGSKCVDQVAISYEGDRPPPYVQTADGAAFPVNNPSLADLGAGSLYAFWSETQINETHKFFIYRKLIFVETYTPQSSKRKMEI
jgi:hypothetical protein